MISFDAFRTRICPSAVLTLARRTSLSNSHSLINSRKADISAISESRNAARSAASPVEDSAIVLIRARSIEALIFLILTNQPPRPLIAPDRATHVGVEISEKTETNGSKAYSRTVRTMTFGTMNSRPLRADNFRSMTPEHQFKLNVDQNDFVFFADGKNRNNRMHGQT
jgi:hypothetical protein